MAEATDASAPAPERLESLGGTGSVAMLIVDDDRFVLEVNEAACGLLSASADELVGKTLDALIAPTMHDRLDSVWQAFRDQRGHAGPFDLSGSPGEHRPVDIGVTCQVMPGRHLVVLVGAGERVPAPIEPRARGDSRTPTSRELEVLALLATGATDGQIARKLALSPATVQTHVRNAKAKLAARTRAQAVAVALRRGMISVTL